MAIDRGHETLLYGKREEEDGGDGNCSLAQGEVGENRTFLHFPIIFFCLVIALSPFYDCFCVGITIMNHSYAVKTFLLTVNVAFLDPPSIFYKKVISCNRQNLNCLCGNVRNEKCPSLLTHTQQ